MAGNRIAGITIEIDGDSTPLQKALKGIDSSLSMVQKDLKDVNRELKFNPDSLGLWEQKQRLVNDAMQATRERLSTLQEAYAQLGARMAETDPNSEEYAQLAEEMNRLGTEIALTESQLETYGQQSEEAAANVDRLSDATSDAEGGAEGLGDAADSTAGDMGELASETEEAGSAAENASNSGWTVAKQILADLAEKGIQAAVDGLKKLAGAMKDSVTDSAAFADEILTLSAQTHLSTDTLQEFYYATELMDVPVETVSKSLTKLTNTMADADAGSASASETFEKLGINIYDTDGSMRSAESVFYEMIDAMGQVANETERDAMAYDLFGRSAKELNPLIEMGSEGLADLQAEAHAAGAVMDGDMLGSLGAVDDAMQRMDQAVQVVQRNFAVALAPAISAVGEELASLSADAGWQDLFSELGEAVAEIIPDLLSMARTILPAIISVLRQIMPTITQIISFLPQLQPIIDAILMVIQRLTPILMRLTSQLLPPLIDIIVATLPILEPILDILDPLLEILGPLLSVVLSALSIALKALVQIISGSVQPVIIGLQKAAEKLAPIFSDMSAKLQNVQHTMGNAWTAIQNACVTAVNAMKNTVSNVWNGIKNTTTSIWNGIKTAIMTPINAAVSGVQTAISKIKGFFSGLSLKLPSIKLPHFSISGSFSLNPPKVPSISVRWYADAMKDGMILTNPTIFGAMNGRLLGAGEAGPEAIVGTRSLYNMIQNAVANTGAINNSVNVVVYGAPGQNVNELADIIEDRITANIARRRAAF